MKSIKYMGIALVAAFVAAGIVLIFVLQIPKRRLRDEEF